MNRRRFLRAGAGVALVGGTGGCLSQLGFETQRAGEPALVEDRPDAVYVPSHVEGMEMAGMADAGPFAVALSYSYPHRFWLLTGQDRERVDVDADDSVHLMARIWDRETSVVVPTGNVTFEVRQDGERVLRRPPWPMLSQNMGFHFGDNVALPGEGSYDVTVEVGPISAGRTGAFRDRFDSSETAEFTFEFSRQAVDEISYRRLEDRMGERGALEPMGMETIPSGQLAEAEALPGRPLGEARSGDGRFVVVALDEPPSGIDAAGTYLAVSARTPYNRYPIPFMSISGSLSREGEVAFEEPLESTLDPDLGYHYGATVDAVEPGDELSLEFGAPPQVSRHEGYETAFLQFEPVSFTVE